MALVEVELFNDVVNRGLVLGVNNNSSFALGPVFAGEQMSLRWFPLKPTYAKSAPFFTKLALAGLTLRAGIGARAGAATPVASQDVWTVDNAAGCLVGVLDLNTAELIAALGAAESISTLWFELRVLEAGNYRFCYQQQITVNAPVMDPTAGAPVVSAAARYYTAAEMDKTFVKFVGNPDGSTIDLASASGLKHRLIGCNDDGSALDGIV